jgi:hypothetical protein
MPEIGTSGCVSREGWHDRRVAAWPKRPRPSSTLPHKYRAILPDLLSVVRDDARQLLSIPLLLLSRVEV